jgi:cytochrome c2
MSRRKITILVGVVIAVVAVFALISFAGAATTTFPDIIGHWAQKEIEQVAARGIVTGKDDGLFHPEDTATRAQIAVMFAREEDAQLAPIAARRGCTACHAGPYSLAAEAANAVKANGGTHPSLAADASFAVCMACHSPKAGGPDGAGSFAPLSLRTIVHPAHMGSNVFKVELGGNCFSCHEISADGTYKVLPVAVTTRENGVPLPGSLPVPGAIDPSAVK